MTINIKDNDINYIQYGEGPDIVLLHGWGQNIEMMKPLGNGLSKNYRITILDLPGHGNSSELNLELSILDYCDILEEFLKKLNIFDPIVMGHSFGGRIAILYAARNKAKKLILFGTPCFKKNDNISFKVRLLKSLKRIPILNKLEHVAKKHIGSDDYKNANPIMRKVLVNTVNTDLSDYARKIKCPTLLIWGSNDEAVLVDDARKLEKLISDSGLIVYEGGTHYVYLEFINPIINVLKNFL